MRRCCVWALGLLAIAACGRSVQAQEEIAPELVVPSQANPNVHEADEPNVVLVPHNVAPDAPLAVFMPGTDGKPQNAMRILRVMASQGYRVIGLEYNDVPAANVLCWTRPNPLCLERFREMRSFARAVAPVQNNAAESIEGRLIAVLRYLDREHPEDGWGQYLAQDGQPQWQRILLSGLSQGAGMAAFIAKQKRVYRVVLFSSPWDFLPPNRRPAEWMSRPSVTPPERWWAERHARENTTKELATAYQALRVPSDHTFVFDQGLPAGRTPTGDNPYHASTIQNPAYEPLWRQMFGSVGR